MLDVFFVLGCVVSAVRLLVSKTWYLTIGDRKDVCEVMVVVVVAS
jgi:hypothetical protein